MRSIGPFLLTEEEFSGLQFRMEEDQHLLRALNRESRPSLLLGFDFGTGESGETADVEAESARVENSLVVHDVRCLLQGFEKPSSLRR